MTGHRKIRRLLYDHVLGELPPGDAAAVSAHLAHCRRCAADAEALRDVAAGPAAPGPKPSDALPGQYWDAFAARVMRSIEHPAGRRPDAEDAPAVSRLLERAAALFDGVPGGRRTAIGAGTLAAAALAAVLLLAGRSGEPAGDGIGPGPAPAGTADAHAGFDKRVDRYFRRSKTLLVGLSNLDPAPAAEAAPVDLEPSAERILSQALLRETRALREGPVDARAALLMDEMERILVGVANGRGGPDPREVGLIRESLAENNLLFRLRVRETGRAGFDAATVSYRQ